MEGKIYLQGGERDFNQMIAQAIPTYTMSIFKLLKALCDSIDSTLAKYWWGQTKDEKKIHWIYWRKLCTKKKKKKGGMGFRDIQAFNLAMLAKQAWRLIHHTLSFTCIQSMILSKLFLHGGRDWTQPIFCVAEFGGC